MEYPAALEQPHVREMDFTGIALKGFIHVAAEGFQEDQDLGKWITMALSFVESLPPK